jgi:hypothetical protein
VWRAASLLVTALALAGCGASESEQLDEAENNRRPLILLESVAGRQQGVGGSSCVYDAAAGVGTCGATGAVAPDRLSTVRPGEEVRVLIEGADVTRPAGCVSEDEQACIGSAIVRPLGCEDETVAEIPLSLGPETAWSVDLSPGDYELDVVASFDAPDGRYGQVSGSLGLRVDPNAPREIVAAVGPSSGCAG